MTTKIDRFQGETRWLSNFEYALIVYEGISYPTNEHAFQATKTLDFDKRREIAKLSTPRDAKRAGRLLELRPDWEEVKLGIMFDINSRKFWFHEHLKEKLLLTGDAELIEGNSWGDTFWGVCNGIGRNELGKILMKIRSRMRALEE